MPNLVGIGNSQAPTNAMLGGLAYQDSVGEINIDKIKANISDTAVDVFVYDTRKDSDGGAWRHRTQNTSWYNEGVSQGRGARKEFPTVAVIVAYNNGLKIYDGDDPNLPMWMEAWQYLNDTSGTTNWWGGSGTGTSVAAMNGTVVLGTTTGAKLLHFISDRMSIFYGSAIALPTQPGGISSRNITYQSWQSVDEYFALIAHNNIEDVAMTVLPNAPVDINTGLPIPTFAIATDGGVSVIRDDRKVFDTVATTSGYVQSRKVEFSESGEYLYIIQDPSLIYSYKTSAFNIDRSSGTLAGYAALSFFSGYVSSSGPASTTELTRGNDITINIGHTNTGLALLYPDYAYTSNGLDSSSGRMICRVTKDFNTGWMQGNIKGAFLSDTDTTNLSGGNKVSNGSDWSGASGSQSSTPPTGWTAGNGATFAVETGNGAIGNYIRLYNENNGGAGPNSYMYQAITTEVGKKYKYSAKQIHRATITVYMNIGTSAGGNQLAGSQFVSSSSSTPKQVFGTFTATGTTTYVSLGIISGSHNYTVGWDDVVVTETDDDRSIKNNGLHAYGTITKSAVATGAELVAYSGWNSSNYFRQPYNSELDFGTGDWCYMFWYNPNDSSSGSVLFTRWSRNVNNSTAGRIGVYFNSGNLRCDTTDDGASSYQGHYGSDGTQDTDVWHCGVILRRGLNLEIWIDGNMVVSNVLNSTSDGSYSNSNAILEIGDSPNMGSSDSGIQLALFRASASAPTGEQIKKMYNDEKCLFHENTKCTLHGTSDQIKGLGFDDTNNVLHVGTSSGRSEFQGLNRINNTTTSVTTAISVSNEFVAEQ